MLYSSQVMFTLLMLPLILWNFHFVQALPMLPTTSGPSGQPPSDTLQALENWVIGQRPVYSGWNSKAKNILTYPKVLDSTRGDSDEYTDEILGRMEETSANKRQSELNPAEDLLLRKASVSSLTENELLHRQMFADFAALDDGKRLGDPQLLLGQYIPHERVGIHAQGLRSAPRDPKSTLASLISEHARGFPPLYSRGLKDLEPIITPQNAYAFRTSLRSLNARPMQQFKKEFNDLASRPALSMHTPADESHKRDYVDNWVKKVNSDDAPEDWSSDTHHTGSFDEFKDCESSEDAFVMPSIVRLPHQTPAETKLNTGEARSRNPSPGRLIQLPLEIDQNTGPKYERSRISDNFYSTEQSSFSDKSVAPIIVTLPY